MSTSLDEATARSEICRVGRSLFDRGYVHATAGNISVRLTDGFLITPTDACLGFLDPDRLARLDADGRQVGGDRASKTIALHRRIYAATAASGHPAGSVIHTHSSSLVACSLKAFEANGTLDGEAELLPPITPYFVMKVGRVPHIPYHRAPVRTRLPRRWRRPSRAMRPTVGNSAP
jgi:3-dehydro-4-phosphotetronate decarboxylase